MNSTEQDKALLRGLAIKDSRAIEQIYRSHYQMVQYLVLQNRGSEDDAADIFQEAMMVLFEKASNPSFELNCQLKTYLYAVCKHLWLKKLKLLKRQPAQVTDMEIAIPVDEDIEMYEKQQQHFDIMEQALHKLGEPCKSLLEAYYIEKQHMQEIAARFLYTNANNAKTQKYKCLMRLKKLFFAQYKHNP